MKAFAEAVLAFSASLGPWAPPAFVAAYVLSAVLMFPCFALTLGAGALFGFGRGCLLVSLGSTLGAWAAFSLGRKLGRRRLEKLLLSYPKLRKVDAALASGGWRVLVLLRMSPVVPYVALNYAAGLTPIPARHFVLASWLGMIPATLAYVYVGSAAKSLAAGSWSWPLWALGLAATVGAMTLLARLAKRALEAA